MSFKIRDLAVSDTELIDQISVFLIECFRKYSPDWVPNESIARSKILESFESDRRSRVLINSNGAALGWIGAITGSKIWEIHPIAVKPSEQRKGFGQALVEDISMLAKQDCVASVWAGTGDEVGATSLTQNNLYTNIPASIAEFESPTDHASQFWKKMGFSLVGVFPDEEGLGKPGIHFAKRIT